MLTDLKSTLAGVFARRKAERAASLAEAADRQSAGEQIDPEDLADLIEAAGETHESYLAMLAEREALRRCRDRMAAGHAAEAKLAAINGKLTAITETLERAEAEAEKARRPLLHEREQVVATITDAATARSEIHRLAPAAHKAAVAELHRRHREIGRDRDKAQRDADLAKSQLIDASMNDRPGIEAMPSAIRTELATRHQRHLAEVARIDSVKREIEGQISAIDRELYTGGGK